MTPGYDALVERIAEAVHEVIRGFCRARGDASQPLWEDAEEWKREAARSGVRFHLDNPLAGPEDSHAAWMQSKQADGWTHGPTKDAEAKTHPCLVPYAELPEDEKVKDHLFCHTTHAFLRVLT